MYNKLEMFIPDNFTNIFLIQNEEWFVIVGTLLGFQAFVYFC